jgi:hypothetical protein
MAKKQPALKLPSEKSIALVLNMAYSAPQANCEVAQQTVAAIREVEAFFRGLYSPASARAAADGGVSPQASAMADGKPSSQA